MSYSNIPIRYYKEFILKFLVFYFSFCDFDFILINKAIFQIYYFQENINVNNKKRQPLGCP